MAEPVIYTLDGPGISVRYSGADLTVDGDDHLLQRSFGPEAITTSSSELGLSVGVVLLPASRNGTKITLTLLLPEVDAAGVGTAEVTGVAVMAWLFQDLVGAAPEVLQEYDVRPLRGSVSPVTTTAQQVT